MSLTKEEKKSLPKYPDEIFDYYKINRVLDLTNSYSSEELKRFNNLVSKSLIDLGNSKQVNLVIVVTTNTEEFALKLLSSWNGGKKNDVIVIIGLEEVVTKDINFIRVHSWTKDNIFNVRLRDTLLEQDKLDLEKTVALIVKEIESSYVRRSFKEFSYLKWSISPSNTALFIVAFLSLAFSIFVGCILANNDEGMSSKRDYYL